MPAFDVPVTDSTGAGDSFAAGVIAAFLGGLDWNCAAALGSALGAATAAQMGAGPSDSLVEDALDVLREPPGRWTTDGFQDALMQAADFLESLSSRNAGLTEQTKELKP